MIASRWFRGLIALIPVAMLAMALTAPVPALAEEGGASAAPAHAGGEANLQLPDLGTVNFFGGCPSGTTVSLDTALIHYSNLTLLASFHHTPRTVRRAWAPGPT